MVNFTKAISNEHMINGLQRLLHANEAVITKCRSTELACRDDGLKKQLRELTHLHESHIRMLTDSIHYLGGSAPDSEPPRKGGDWSASSGGTESAVLETEAEERKLREAYMEALKRLAASDEVVNVINQALRELEQFPRLA